LNPAFSSPDYCVKLKQTHEGHTGINKMFSAIIAGSKVSIQIIPLSKKARSDLEKIKKVDQKICFEGNITPRW
jgi:hypothetical protein